MPITADEESKGEISTVQIRLPVAIAIGPDWLFQSSSPQFYQPPKLCEGLLLGNENSGRSSFWKTIIDTRPDPAFGLDEGTLEIQNVRFKVWDTPGRGAHRGINTAFFQRIRFILFFGDKVDEINQLIQLAKKCNATFQFYGLTWDKQQNDSTIKPQSMPLTASDSIVGIADKVLPPKQMSRENTHSVRETLLSDVVLNLMEAQQNTLVSDTKQQKACCSVM